MYKINVNRSESNLKMKSKKTVNQLSFNLSTRYVDKLRCILV